MGTGEEEHHADGRTKKKKKTAWARSFGTRLSFVPPVSAAAALDGASWLAWLSRVTAEDCFFFFFSISRLRSTQRASFLRERSIGPALPPKRGSLFHFFLPSPSPRAALFLLCPEFLSSPLDRSPDDSVFSWGGYPRRRAATNHPSQSATLLRYGFGRLLLRAHADSSLPGGGQE